MLVDPVATESSEEESLDEWGPDPPSVGYGNPEDDEKVDTTNQRVS